MLAYGRLAAKACWRGELTLSDCESLPELSKPVEPVFATAQRLWQEERSKRGEKSSVWNVVLGCIWQPLVMGWLALTLRAIGNTLILPLLLNAIIEAIEQVDTRRAVHLLHALVWERIVGAVVEFCGDHLCSTQIPTGGMLAVSALLIEKSSSPGILGLEKAGVDPSALFGRELTLLHIKAVSTLPHGALAIPTLISGFVTLFLLLGWSAIFGVVWTLFTIRVGIQVQEYGKKAAGRMAEVATERLGIVENVVAASKAIKYFSWEPEFTKSLLDVRAVECERLKARSRFTALAMAIGKVTPVTGSLVTFVAFALLGNEIRAGTIFAANSVFLTMRFSVGASTFFIELVKALSLTFSRVDKFLRLPERPPRAMLPPDATPLASIQDLKVFFPQASTEGCEAQGFHFNVDGCMELGCAGKLTAICGPVGSGKSVLVSALLGGVGGDASIEGQVRTVPEVGWCPQKPFVMSGTVEENILLGRPLDPSAMERCLGDACLGLDLEQWTDGVDELVGDRGTTLSGGQQARLGFARALYGNPSLLLLDDPLAAVDPTVARAMLHSLRLRCAGKQADRTSNDAEAKPTGAIVVLNQLQLLPNFDQVVFVKAGAVAGVGTFAELQSNPGFREFMDQIDLQERSLDSQHDVEHSALEKVRIAKILKSRSSGEKRAIRGETVSTGFVRWAVWRSYLFSPGRCVFGAVLAVYVCMYLTLGLRDWWMAVWADEDGGAEAIYVGLFVLFGVSHIVVVLLSVLLIGVFSSRAGRQMHSDCVHSLMHAPMSYFDTTPSGRITSRFGTDLGTCDEVLPIALDIVFTFGFMALMMSGTVMAKLPAMAVIFLAAMLMSFPVCRGLFILQQDFKRHSNHAMSPLLTNLSDLRRGAALASAMRCQSFFTSRHASHSRAWKVLTDGCSLTVPASSVWCHAMHVIVLGTTGALTFLDAEAVADAPGLVAMYFSYAALWGTFAMAMMRAILLIFKQGASLERVLEFKLSGLPQEPAWRLASDPSREAWPRKGAVNFQNVSLRYGEDLPLVLKAFSLDIAGGEKIGIVGRTGAGKSTITTILFRLVECAEGRVTIDDVDIAGLGLHTLRQAISMIPQEPLVMSGTVRYNLDPFGKQDSERLLGALTAAGLSAAVTLDTAAGGAGAGLSAGQKQLLTFARTLLQDTQVVMMDEPTASVDMQTDRVVQRISREAFLSRTVLTIAHRLDTVRHCDRLAVLDAGVLVELGPPDDLLADPESRLSKLVAADGTG